MIPLFGFGNNLNAVELAVLTADTLNSGAEITPSLLMSKLFCEDPAKEPLTYPLS